MKSVLLVFGFAAASQLLCGQPRQPTQSQQTSADAAERAAELPNAVVQFPLLEDEPVFILTSTNVTTLVSFPYPLDDYTGFGFAFRPDDVEGNDFLLRIAKGEKYFSVKPLVDGANRNLHLVMNGGRTFQLVFLPSDQAKAQGTVRLVDVMGAKIGSAQAPSATTTKAKRSEAPPTSLRAAATPPVLIGLMDFAKLLANLSSDEARAMAAKRNAAQAAKLVQEGTITAEQAQEMAAQNLFTKLVIKDTSPYEAGEYSVSQYFVLRDGLLDALCFVAAVKNTTDAANLTFEPNGFMVRAGENTYFSSLADFNPKIAPGVSEVAMFIIAGRMDGGANLLDPDQPFTITPELLKRESVRPVTAVEIQ